MQTHWEAFVRTKYSTKDATAIISKMDWNKWVKTPGLPPITMDFKTAEFTESTKLADDYITLKGNASPAGWERFKTYIEGLKAIFVN
jgi:leukotriene-A4 hydrolase